MRGDYPQFRKSYTSDELTEDFLLDKEEYQFIQQFRGDINRQTVAVLLKALKYLGYFPESLIEIPEDIKLFVAQQLSLLLDLTQQYPWQSRSRDTHFAMIREFTSYRFATREDKQALEKWLEVDAKPNNYTEEGFIECAFERLKELKIELPSEKELCRIVNAALNNYFQLIYQQIFQQLTPEVNQQLDKLLVIEEAETYSCFDKLKDDADRAGVKKLQVEVSKLQTLRATGVTPIIFQTIPWKVLQVLKRRAKNEKVSEIRQHPEKVRNSLLASFVFVRSSEVIDDIAQMTLDLINKVDIQTDKQLNRELLADVKKVEGKVQILFRVAELVTKNPDGKIREVIFSEVKEDTFRDLVTEFQASGAQYKQIHQKLMKRKYSCHYRQILPLLLENITFRSDNRFQPIIEALAVT